MPFLALDMIRQAHSDHDMVLLDMLGRKLRERGGTPGCAFDMRLAGQKMGRPKR